MHKCPICLNDMKNEYVCASCDYDIRKDFVQLRTVCMVPKSDVRQYLVQSQGKPDTEQEIKDKTTTENVEQKKKRQKGLWKLFIVLMFARLLLSFMSGMSYSVAQTVSDITLYILIVILLITPAVILLFVMRLVRKKPVKKMIYIIEICAIVFIICFVLGRFSNGVVNYYETICEYGVCNISFL